MIADVVAGGRPQKFEHVVLAGGQVGENPNPGFAVQDVRIPSSAARHGHIVPPERR